MGYVQRQVAMNDITELKTLLQPYPSNDYIRNLVQNYAVRFPDRMRVF